MSSNTLTLASRRCLFGVLALSFLLTAAPVFAVNIFIVNMDGPGEGFNDPTVVAPVGGNPGTTLGQQRLIVFQQAAAIWGATLDSAVDIYVQASLDPLPCSPTSATLGQAGTLQVSANFGGAPLSNTWYHIALANKLAGVDLIPGAPGTAADDIGATFNSSIDNNPSCLPGNWYYGLDHNESANDIDFLAVLQHEFNHGLGMANFTNESTGALLGPPFYPGIFDVFTLDTDLGLTWDSMTNAQRAASAVNCGGVVWNGPNVTTFAPLILDSGVSELLVNSPVAIAGDYQVGDALFGPVLTSPGITGDLELVNDGVGTVTDGCEPLIGFTSGNVALIDRGSCPFVQKVQNAEAAGATAVVVADNVAGCPPDQLGGTGTTNIPAARISLADGNTIKAQLPGVNVTLGVDDNQLQGANDAGQVLIYSPDPLEPGSTLSHWDVSASPDLLMEPFFTSGLTDDLDLSPMQLADIGWMLQQTCGNNTREGLEVCDGTDLFGQTCISQGFDGGTLACDGTCTGFDTSACVTCVGAKTDGRWNLPDLSHLGELFGYLYDPSGTAIYKIWGTLVETSPAGGIAHGVVYDGSLPHPFYFTGTWTYTQPDNGGFNFTVFEYGTGANVGFIQGRWKDNPLFSSVGGFGGTWQICQ